MDALAQIREMKANEKEKNRRLLLEQHRENVRQGRIVDNPLIVNNRLLDSTMKSAVDENRNVDISELSLDEKEKVLRILFAKMNGAVTDPSHRSHGGAAPGLFSMSPTGNDQSPQTQSALTSGFASPTSTRLGLHSSAGDGSQSPPLKEPATEQKPQAEGESKSAPEPSTEQKSTQGPSTEASEAPKK